MKDQRWVQHVSGQGEKYLVNSVGLDDHGDAWFVFRAAKVNNFWLPKSEYVLCAPPENWKDITEQLEGESDGSEFALPHEGHWAINALTTKGYRFRKVLLFDHGQKKDGSAFLPVEQWAFIVERKAP